MTTEVLVVDYGIGNVFSVCNALVQAGATPNLTGNVTAIRKADRVVLPGVGAFARAMEALHEKGLADAIHDYVGTGRPFLGICIGMQVLMDKSTEFGEHKGLGLVPGKVDRLASQAADGSRLRVPHIGWSTLQIASEKAAGAAMASLAADDAVYFVHSYHCQPANAEHRLATADYHGVEVTAAIRRDNVLGVQFHPERSGRVGHKLLRHFLTQ